MPVASANFCLFSLLLYFQTEVQIEYYHRPTFVFVLLMIFSVRHYGAAI
jgi:hypothetical protein